MRLYAALAALALVVAAGFGLHRYQVSLIEQGKQAERVDLLKRSMRQLDALADVNRDLQEKADAARKEANTLRSRARADSAAAGAAVDGLRDDLDRARTDDPGPSCAAAVERANTAGVLLLECAAEYREMARAADAHVADLVETRGTWPALDEFRAKVRGLLEPPGDD